MLADFQCLNCLEKYRSQSADEISTNSGIYGNFFVVVAVPCPTPPMLFHFLPRKLKKNCWFLVLHAALLMLKEGNKSKIPPLFSHGMYYILGTCLGLYKCVVLLAHASVLSDHRWKTTCLDDSSVSTLSVLLSAGNPGYGRTSRGRGKSLTASLMLTHTHT